MKNYNKWTKKQLLMRIEILEIDNDRLESQLEHAPSEYQLDERYDRGYDEGYHQGQRESKEYLSNAELSDYDNVIRFG